ncbi:hypothetical protein J6590_054254 [Homalodisca vitripennis]|nr:hypothetical protein J6590_054254 [Homalodisca vitripennis]
MDWIKERSRFSRCDPHTLKDLLHIPEADHKAYQSTVSAVPQTVKNNLSIRSSWRNSPPLSKLPKLAYCSLAIAGHQSSGVQQFSPVHHTFYRAYPPEGCRLCEDAFSGDHVP